MNKERINNAIKNTNIVRDMFIKMCDNYIDSQKKIDKAIELIEKYLNREYVITDEYFECIIQILRGEE